MFIHSVKTPRGITVQFGIPASNQKNHISLLTGPNGSGKTDVVASIAQVFHGNSRKTDAVVKWSKGSSFYTSTAPRPRYEGDEEYDYDYDRVRLVAQTFSPFSRFPAVRRPSPQYLAAIYARGDETEENYACIGFNQKSRIELRKFSFSIIENAILRLSERQNTARAAFEVLRELSFKDGIGLKYLADRKLSYIIELIDNADQLERTLAHFAKTGELKLGSEIFSGRVLHRLLRELRAGDVNETAEYLRHAINLISEYSTGTRIVKRRRVGTYHYTAFKGEQSMSSDFAYLQAFSVLSRLELIRVDSCELQPIGGMAIDIRRASSGQQQMLCSIFGLAAAVDDHAIVLIDEPELSLHPRWQMNFFKYLESILDSVSGCHAIIATHSPLLVQAAALHNVQVISMGSESIAGKSTSSSRTTGNSVEKMLVDIFDTPIPDSLHISKEVFGLITKAESGTFLDKMDSSEQLKKYLALYQREGEGSREMTSLLVKALTLVESASPARG